MARSYARKETGSIARCLIVARNQIWNVFSFKLRLYAVTTACWHQVTQRGNRRQTVFFDDTDRTLYLQLLARYAGQHSVRIAGYCLMGNHVHFIVIPPRGNARARSLGRAHLDYARWLNLRRGETGHVWQSAEAHTGGIEWHRPAGNWISRSGSGAGRPPAGVRHGPAEWRTPRCRNASGRQRERGGRRAKRNSSRNWRRTKGGVCASGSGARSPRKLPTSGR